MNLSYTYQQFDQKCFFFFRKSIISVQYKLPSVICLWFFFIESHPILLVSMQLQFLFSSEYSLNTYTSLKSKQWKFSCLFDYFFLKYKLYVSYSEGSHNPVTSPLYPKLLLSMVFLISATNTNDVTGAPKNLVANRRFITSFSYLTPLKSYTAVTPIHRSAFKLTLEIQKKLVPTNSMYFSALSVPNVRNYSEHKEFIQQQRYLKPVWKTQVISYITSKFWSITDLNFILVSRL